MQKTPRTSQEAWTQFGLECCTYPELKAWFDYAVNMDPDTHKGAGFFAFCEDCTPEFRAARTAEGCCVRAKMEDREYLLGLRVKMHREMANATGRAPRGRPRIKPLGLTKEQEREWRRIRYRLNDILRREDRKEERASA